jgi:hypothetical protein
VDIDGVRHGILKKPDSQELYVSKETPSNVFIEFVPEGKKDYQKGREPASGKVTWKLSRPGENKSYCLFNERIPFRCSFGKVEILYRLSLKEYKPGGSPAYPIRYSDVEANAPTETLRELQAIDTIETAAREAANALEALKMKEEEEAVAKAKQEAADAQHQAEVIKLRDKCFPFWESEKALRKRLSGVLSKETAASVNSDIEGIETKMMAGVEILLSYARLHITWTRVETLMTENQVPKEFQGLLHRSYTAFGLSEKWAEAPTKPESANGYCERRRDIPLPYKGIEFELGKLFSGL